MKSVAILCNGAFPSEAYPLYLLESASVVVCCDGAFQNYYSRYGKLPEAVVGDMDSVDPPLRERFPSLLVHESEQETNDLTKAMRYVLGKHPDVSEIHILGATGLREDHTVGNLGLLMEYNRMFSLGDIRVDMVSDFGTAFTVCDTCELHLGQGRRVSLFSPDNTLRLCSEGLHWKTDDVVWDSWWKATLNRADKDVVKLTFSHPSVVLIIVD